MKHPAPGKSVIRGTSLVEVLVAMVILAIGLLALAALQMRLQVSDQESYQRSQAIALVQDMASRIDANRANAAQYTTAAIGTGSACPTVDNTSSRSQIDLSQWCLALQGASEKIGASNAGAMIGARGCVGRTTDGSYLVTVTWQGLMNLQAPSDGAVSGLACASGSYDDGKRCTNDQCRRAVTTLVAVGGL